MKSLSAVVVLYFTASEKDNLRTKSYSYKEQKLSQCTGKQNYVMKNENNSLLLLEQQKNLDEVAQSKAIRRTELEISWPSLDSSAMRNPLLSEALLLSFNVIFNLPTNILPSFLKKFSVARILHPDSVYTQSVVRCPQSAVNRPPLCTA